MNRPFWFAALLLAAGVLAAAAPAARPVSRAGCAPPSVQLTASLDTYANGFGGRLYAVSFRSTSTLAAGDAGPLSESVVDETGAVVSSLGTDELSLPPGPHTLTLTATSPCGTGTSSSSVVVPPHDWTARLRSVGKGQLKTGHRGSIGYDVFAQTDVWYLQASTVRFRVLGSGVRLLHVVNRNPTTTLACTYNATSATCVGTAAAKCAAVLAQACGMGPTGTILFVPTRADAPRITIEIAPAVEGDSTPGNDAATAVLRATG